MDIKATVEKAAKKLGITIEELEKLMEETELE